MTIRSSRTRTKSATEKHGEVLLVSLKDLQACVRKTHKLLKVRIATKQEVEKLWDDLVADLLADIFRLQSARSTRSSRRRTKRMSSSATSDERTRS